MARKRSLGRQNPPQIHMYTEGQTEVLYFNQLKKHFRVKSGKKLTVKQINKQGLKLFHHVKTLYRKHDFKVSPTDIILVVDKDQTSISELEQLKESCNQKGYQLMFSNHSFELWILLHFEKVSTYMENPDLIKKLNKLVGGKYQKTDNRFVEKLVITVQKAIEHSKEMSPEIQDFKQNPYTNVGKIIPTLFTLDETS
ncbi:hypothetical protein GKS17_00700 [Streptococcus uberis]|uniref:RloB family protein n=1 Tax=Streptococcus uberis TaxID=1349 RepID=UPI0012B64ABC|nr:RloB family protein [Streptococcus uberis]MBI0907912.1 RloB domain-containing protein [Streptococcus uberis]MCK1256685.1 RloB family protein [Streptococcus uberis]MTC90535.1 hypothetical protein [Streptococcus uberis]MTC95322.1 hypothetical protein [Streptococcus uberis]